MSWLLWVKRHIVVCCCKWYVSKSEKFFRARMGGSIAAIGCDADSMMPCRVEFGERRRGNLACLSRVTEKWRNSVMNTYYNMGIPISICMSHFYVALEKVISSFKVMLQDDIKKCNPVKRCVDDQIVVCHKRTVSEDLYKKNVIAQFFLATEEVLRSTR